MSLVVQNRYGLAANHGDDKEDSSLKKHQPLPPATPRTRSRRNRRLLQRLYWFQEIVRPLVKTHRYHLRYYPNCFVGREAVSRLVEKGWSNSREDAVQQTLELVKEFQLLEHVCQAHLFSDAYLFFRFTPKGRAETLQSEDLTVTNTSSLSLCWSSDGGGASSSLSLLAPLPLVTNDDEGEEPPNAETTMSQVLQRQALSEIANAIAEDELKRDRLTKLIEHNKTLARVRLESGNDVGAVVLLKQLLRQQAWKQQAENALVQLRELQQEGSTRQPDSYYQSQLDWIRSIPPPEYLVFDTVEDLLDQAHVILGLEEDEQEKEPRES